jgi:hypothetical protein
MINVCFLGYGVFHSQTKAKLRTSEEIKCGTMFSMNPIRSSVPYIILITKQVNPSISGRKFIFKHVIIVEDKYINKS